MVFKTSLLTITQWQGVLMFIKLNLEQYNIEMFNLRQILSADCSGRNPCEIMAKLLDYVNEFNLQSSYYIHFQTNTFGKGMNLLSLLVPQLFVHKDVFGIT